LGLASTEPVNLRRAARTVTADTHLPNCSAQENPGAARSSEGECAFRAPKRGESRTDLKALLKEDRMSRSGSVIVAGAGPGLGFAISRRFAREGYGVLMVARDRARLDELTRHDPQHLAGFAADLTDPAAIQASVQEAERRFGPLVCAVHNAAPWRTGSVLEIDPADFESSWRLSAFAGLLLGQAAGRRMVKRHSGTILFTGATASRRGGSGFANFAPHKFALRALAQSLARELGPAGVHVAHVIIDGQIRSAAFEHLLTERGPDTLLEPDAIAEAYWQLHQQHRSAWTHELDLRPWAERF
jgi:NAD(P)-dependent dehydrogenase (short-subunit alcohol dehydrogenase family)